MRLESKAAREQGLSAIKLRKPADYDTPPGLGRADWTPSTLTAELDAAIRAALLSHGQVMMEQSREGGGGLKRREGGAEKGTWERGEQGEGSFPCFSASCNRRDLRMS